MIKYISPNEHIENELSFPSDKSISHRAAIIGAIADGKTVPITAPAAKLSRTPLSIRMPAPTLGEHNSEILGELGYDEESRKVLRRDGVI